MPAIEIPTATTRQFASREISPPLSEGMVLMSRSSLGDLWKAWPQFLLYCHACQLHPTPMEKQLLLVHPSVAAKQFTAFFDDSTPHLVRFLDHYFACLTSPSPLMPDWIPHILNGDAPALKQTIEKQLTNPFSLSYDDYIPWSLNPASMPNCDEMVVAWQPHADALLGDLVAHWMKP